MFPRCSDLTRCREQPPSAGRLFAVSNALSCGKPDILIKNKTIYSSAPPWVVTAEGTGERGGVDGRTGLQLLVLDAMF